jgi:hypothetical protein
MVINRVGLPDQEAGSGRALNTLHWNEMMDWEMG